MAEPRIKFKELKGFPIVEEKIKTAEFLEAAKEVVTVIETFGKLFTPVVNDMHGNIKKLTSVYEKDSNKFHCLEELIAFEGDINNFAADALLWLKRGLLLICIFFENIYNDAEQEQALKKHLQDAYEKTLKPYHGFIVQSTVRIIYSWVPNRTQLIGHGPAHDENIKMLEMYLPSMRFHLNKIDNLLKELQFDKPGKV